jgi:hypothetical protein
VVWQFWGRAAEASWTAKSRTLFNCARLFPQFGHLAELFPRLRHYRSMNMKETYRMSLIETRRKPYDQR